MTAVVDKRVKAAIYITGLMQTHRCQMLDAETHLIQSQKPNKQKERSILYFKRLKNEGVKQDTNAP